MTYSIRTESREGQQVIVAVGEFDSAAAPDLETAIRTACEADPSGTVTIDLTQAEFVDSRTMSLLVAWTERQRTGGGSLEIAGANPNVLRVFRQIGLDSELNLVPTSGEQHT